VLISPAESSSELGLGIAATLYSTYKLGRCAAARGVVARDIMSTDMDALTPTDRYKTFWRRFWAGWLDTLVFLPLAWLAPAFVAQSWPRWIIVFWLIFSSFAFVLYSIVLHGLKGQTLGKMVCRIKVLDIAESPLKMRQAILRDIFNLVFAFLNVMCFLPNLDLYIKMHTAPDTVSFPLWYWVLTYSALGLFVIEMVTMLTNEKRRALHDWIAGSVVIRDT